MGFFEPPAWVPQMPFGTVSSRYTRTADWRRGVDSYADSDTDPPDSIPISEFMLTEKYGRTSFADSKDPFTCGISGLSFTIWQQKDRSDALARGLSQELGWSPTQATEWDKVVGVYSLNTVDYMTLAYAVFHLSGIVTPVNASYSIAELEFQLKSAGAKVLFTCIPLLETALQAAKAVGIPNKHVYILGLAKEITGEKKVPFKTVDDLIVQGQSGKALEPLRFKKGQGEKQTAFLCYSSGTSGLPKGVMVSHRNVIANIMQSTAFESLDRSDKSKNGKPRSDIVLGLLPQSHIYGLVVVNGSATYRGDQVVILPKFEIKSFLGAIQTYKINSLYLVPPIIIQMVKNKAFLDKYDLSSVRSLFSGAAPLGAETAEALQAQYPTWKIRQGYGLTETCTVVCSTPFHDIWFGSSGSLFPGFRAKIVSPEGKEIMEYNTPGELVVQSPSVVLGYLKNDKANEETFLEDTDGRGKWMKTGDEAEIRKAPSGFEHIFITDRIKELIKCKGHQVAPAELEAHILTHTAVADVAVIGVHDDHAGEVPKAFVVKSSLVGLEESDRKIAREIEKHVEEHKARYKWLKGGIEFVDVIPKSASGKILRRILRDQAKAQKKKQGAKI